MRQNFGRKPSLVRVAGSAIALLATVLVACGPAATTPGGASGEQARAQTGPKTLHMAMQSEPPAVVMYGFPTSALTPHVERWLIFHAGLTSWDFQGQPTPRIATKVPSIQDGDWKINGDGSMDVTWKLRPDVYWHDGTQLTAEDFAFGYQLALDKRLAVPAVGDLVKVSEVRAVDPLTLQVKWSVTSIWGNANEREGFPALPKHLLNEVYTSGDPLAVDNHPIWQTDWVGLGPYRIKEIQGGSFYEAEAFDKFFLGKPKIDRLFLHWIPDVNVLNAQLLAGAIDLAPLGSMLKPEQIMELKRSWVAEGKGEAYSYPNSMRTVFLQFRDQNAPWAKDARFRQGMMYAMNRDSYVNDLQYGQTIFANYYTMFDNPLIQLAEQRGIVKYNYDPTRASRLFSEAGWTMGADKVLHNAAGEAMPTFRCCRIATGTSAGDSNDARESLAVNDDLKAVGIPATYPLPSAPAGLSTADSRRFTTLNRDGNIGPYFFSSREGFATMTTYEVGTESNRYTGRNAGGWSNSTYDDLQARSQGLINQTERREPEVQMLKMIAEEVPVLPMYYNPVGVAVRKGVEGITEKQHTPNLSLATSWNVHLWDLK